MFSYLNFGLLGKKSTTVWKNAKEIGIECICLYAKVNVLLLKLKLRITSNDQHLNFTHIII